MKHPLASTLALLALAAGFAANSASAEVTIDWVKIGNPGNLTRGTNNHAAAWTNSATTSVTNNTGVGAVNYTYRMARNKTTIAEYTEFLNLKAKYIATDGFTYDGYTLDTYRLWNPRMSVNSTQNSAGITRSGAGTVGDPFTYTYYTRTRSGSPGAYVYTNNVGVGGNRPVTYVSWFDAARFANWIQNGQGNGNTEDGSYTLNGLFTVSATYEVPKLNAGASVRIPSGDEWVKAAYYDPTKVNPDSSVGGYWLLGNKTDTLPAGNNDVGSPGAINSRSNDFALTPGDNAQDVNINYLTDVGAYGPGSRSYYGVNDMAGLTWDWNDNLGGTDPSAAVCPGRRQGSYLSTDTNGQLYQPRAGNNDAADQQNTNSGRREDLFVGFRLASSVVDHFVISAIGSPQTVGTPITGITITAQDYTNATATGFTGTVTFSGTAGFTGTSASFVNGVLSGVSLTPTVEGSNLTLVVSDSGSPTVHTGSTTIATVGTAVAAVDHFAISAIVSPQTVGIPITGITITAQDATNATATGFTGTVSFGGTAGVTGTSASFVGGVLSGVSVTPTVAGSNLTLTVNDGASHTGSTTIATVQTPYGAWATGSEPFDGDTNGDGVKDGVAFLLGAASPSASALGKLPTVNQIGGSLVMEFDCLATADRGASVLNLLYDGDLVAPWTSVVVPGAVGNTTVGNVSFVATANGQLIHIVATINDPTEAAGGKLFSRLEGNQ